MSNRFGRIPACDRQTDGQTDGQIDILRRHSPRYAYASRGKKRQTNSDDCCTRAARQRTAARVINRRNAVVCRLYWLLDARFISDVQHVSTVRYQPQIHYRYHNCMYIDNVTFDVSTTWFLHTCKNHVVTVYCLRQGARYAISAVCLSIIRSVSLWAGLLQK